MNYWLMKSEPDAFSIDDLQTCPDQTERWDGVRNYQARNFMRDQMRVGDKVFFYHSSCAEPGIVGTAVVVKEGYPDRTALDPDSKYYDPKSTAQEPRWFMVDIRLEQKFKHTITLKQLKSNPQLADMLLLKRGSRLSVMPVTEAEWRAVIAML